MVVPPSGEERDSRVEKRQSERILRMRETERGVLEQARGHSSGRMDGLALEPPDRHVVVGPHRLRERAQQVEDDAQSREGAQRAKRRTRSGELSTRASGGRGRSVLRTRKIHAPAAEAAASARNAGQPGGTCAEKRAGPSRPGWRRRAPSSRRSARRERVDRPGSRRATRTRPRARPRRRDGPDPRELEQEVRHGCGTTSAPSSHSWRTRPPGRPRGRHRSRPPTPREARPGRGAPASARRRSARDRRTARPAERRRARRPRPRPAGGGARSRGRRSTSGRTPCPSRRVSARRALSKRRPPIFRTRSGSSPHGCAAITRPSRRPAAAAAAPRAARAHTSG